MAHNAYKAALQYYLDQGVDEVLESAPSNKISYNSAIEEVMREPAPEQGQMLQAVPSNAPAEPFLGKSDARAEAIKLANEASTLEELQRVIAEFDGIALKQTATNLVFCDGNPAASVMLVGEAPGADEDRQGKPFVGISGQLLDRILKCIDLDRTEEDPAKAVYISNILNWRPPGNRTPSPAEIEVSLPFIEKHIALVKPKVLIFCGGVSAKALLGRGEGVSKLRKTFHEYKPQTSELEGNFESIPAIATYHPAYLLRTPAQKKAVWNDMLMLNQKCRELGLKNGT